MEFMASEESKQAWNCSSFTDLSLHWLNNPTSWGVIDPNGEEEGSGGSFEVTPSLLLLKPPAKKDFWSKTFYSPVLIKHDACGLLHSIPRDVEATIRVTFQYTPVSQFDQAGLLVYIDNDHWMKCGIEFCDGSAKLSVVVCNTYSDWSTQLWPTFGAQIKIHKVRQAESVVVEAAPIGSEEFHFVRIAHLSTASVPNQADNGDCMWRIGPYAACPIAQKGCAVTFTNFSVGPKENSSHSENL